MAGGFPGSSLFLSSHSLESGNTISCDVPHTVSIACSKEQFSAAVIPSKTGSPPSLLLYQAAIALNTSSASIRTAHVKPVCTTAEQCVSSGVDGAERMNEVDRIFLCWGSSIGWMVGRKVQVGGREPEREAHPWCRR